MYIVSSLAMFLWVALLTLNYFRTVV